MLDWIVYGFNVGNIIFNTMLAMAITLVAGKLHEVVHYVVAKRLGYKIISFKLLKNETDVDIKEDDPNFKKIARAPYYVMMPIGAILLCLGIAIYPSEIFLGVSVAGVAILFLHGLSFKFEGKDEKRGEVLLVQKEESDSVVSEKRD